MKKLSGIDKQVHKDLFLLVMDEIAPWATAENGGERENWRLADITIKDEQARVCVMHKVQREQYTALVCCADLPEVIAVSYTNGNLGMLNPYLDCGHKLEADLDGFGCWNVLSITFSAEPGAQAIRFSRQGKIHEISRNQYDAFSLIDWNGTQPVDEYIGVKIAGKWHRPAIGDLPYSIEYVVACWRRAVARDDNFHSRWNRWLTAAFVELCGADRAVLQRKLMNALSAEKNDVYFQAFKKERRKFLRREQAPLNNLICRV